MALLVDSIDNFLFQGKVAKRRTRRFRQKSRKKIRGSCQFFGFFRVQQDDIGYV